MKNLGATPLADETLLVVVLFVLVVLLVATVIVVLPSDCEFRYVRDDDWAIEFGVIMTSPLAEGPDTSVAIDIEELGPPPRDWVEELTCPGYGRSKDPEGEGLLTNGAPCEEAFDMREAGLRSMSREGRFDTALAKVQAHSQMLINHTTHDSRQREHA